MSAQQRLLNVLGKEWAGLRASTSSLLMVTLLPILIVAQVLVVIYLVVHFVNPESLANSILGSGLSKLEGSLPALSQLPLGQRFQVYFYLQLPLYLLLVPLMVSNILVIFSVIEEKQTRTLEPLLATPVRTWELLLGKALAGTIPAVIMSWVSAGVCLLGIALIGPASLMGYVLQPLWLVSLLLLGPLATLLSFILGVIGSARAQDVKGAQNFSVLVILPILALVAMQVLGILPLGAGPLLVIALGLAVIDFLGLRLAILLFRRESILIEWK